MNPMGAWIETVTQHWPEYLMEAALLGAFMISACCFGVLLGHPSSPVVRRIVNPTTRRVLMGLAMGATAAALIYSPWGQRSGAHMNPATTLTFFRLGKVAGVDALFYVAAQLSGGVLGVYVARLFLRGLLSHEAVNHVVTQPGRRGRAVACVAEFVIAFLMMFMILNVTNRLSWAPYTGWLAGALVAIYIAAEAPLSGMSMNPARTAGSAFTAKQWTGFWIYLTAPLCGMLLASTAYANLPRQPEVHCAKLDHCNDERCIFRCSFERLNKQ